MSITKTKLFNDKILSCALIANVSNAAEIRKQLLLGSLQCAVVKPRLIVDIFQVYVAASKALRAESLGKQTTKSIYTEIIFNLSISTNISRSLMTFGIHDSDTEMLVLSFGDDSEMSQVLSHINGSIVNISELKQWTNIDDIKKIYKIKEDEIIVSSLVNIIASKISTKDLMSH